MVALPEDRSDVPACPEPAERRALAGATSEASCTGGAPVRGPARRLFDLPIDPNHADLRTLTTLPGIGPARAAAIVAERERRPFGSREELARVRGIGPHTVARLSGLVSVEPMAENR